MKPLQSTYIAEKFFTENLANKTLHREPPTHPHPPPGANNRNAVTRSTASLIILAIAIVLSARVSAATTAVLKEGMMAPDWMMSDIEGVTHSLYEELDQGNSVVMIFWASWCKYCRELLPEIDLFRRSLTGDQVRFFAMNIWEDGDPVDYFDVHQLDLPLILKADGIAQRFAVEGTPGVVFIKPDRTIAYTRDTGETIPQVMRHLQQLVLEPVLEQQRKATAAKPVGAVGNVSQ